MLELAEVEEDASDTDSSLEELKARRHDESSGTVDEDEGAVTETFDPPGADLSHVVLDVEVLPCQPDEFTCMSCFLCIIAASSPTDRR